MQDPTRNCLMHRQAFAFACLCSSGLAARRTLLSGAIIFALVMPTLNPCLAQQKAKPAARNQAQATPAQQGMALYRGTFDAVMSKQFLMYSKTTRANFAKLWAPEKVGPFVGRQDAFDKAQAMLDSLQCGDRLLDPALTVQENWLRDANGRGSTGLTCSLKHEPVLRGTLPANGNPIVRDKTLAVAAGREDFEVDQRDNNVAPGIEYHDIIVSIDGKLIEGLSSDQARALLCGRRHTSVELTVRRHVSLVPRLSNKDSEQADAFKHLEIQRVWPLEELVKSRAKFGKEHELFEITVGHCDPDSAPYLAKALKEAQANYKGVWLDLRSGHKDETMRIDTAVQGAQLFLEEGVLLEERLRMGDEIVLKTWVLSKDGLELRTTRAGKTFAKPLMRSNRICTKPAVTLVDHDSCLCSRMLAAILQGHGVPCVGEKSFMPPCDRTIVALNDEGWSLDLAVGVYTVNGQSDPAKPAAVPEFAVVPNPDMTGSVPADHQNKAEEILKKAAGIGEESKQDIDDTDGL